MTAASMNQESDKADDLLDDLIGKAPEDHPDDSAAAELGEPEPEAEEAKEEAPEPDPEPVTDEVEEEESEEDEEPGNLRLPEKEEAEEGESSEIEIEQSDDQKKLAASERRSAGLQKALSKLRSQQADLSEKRPYPQPPVPAAPQAPQPPIPTPGLPTPEEANRIPVIVAEDGQSVYVDQEKLNAQMQATAQSAYAEAMRPTPEQVSADNEREMAASFIGADRERNGPIYQSARNAEEFIFKAVTVAAQTQRVHFNTVSDVQSFIHHSGIGEQVKEFFPDVAPMMDEFVAAGMADNPQWKRSVLDRMGESPPQEIASGASEQVEGVKTGPRSLARKGSGRSTSSSADEASFADLEKRFRNDPIFFSEKDEKRMNALGKKLGITGME